MRTIEFLTAGKVRYGASKAQYNYIKSLGGEMNMAENRFCNYFTKQQASEAIDLLKSGNKVVFKQRF